MSVRDDKLFKILEKLRGHYQNNLNNRYIRKALLHMNVPMGTWNALERLTEKSDFYKIQGYPYKDLYEQIHAAATFVYHARTDVLPRLKGLLAGGTETVLSRKPAGEPKDKVLLEMAINNFPANLGVFSDLVNEMYVRAAELDRAEHPGQKPVYEHMPEMKELGKLLT